MQQVYDVLEKSGSVGLYESEIKDETNFTVTRIKILLGKLRRAKKIYKNNSQQRWRLLKYRTEDEKDYSERMMWCVD
jgi:hypothetical protein